MDKGDYEEDKKKRLKEKGIFTRELTTEAMDQRERRFREEEENRLNE